ncbi:MAG: sodium:alanine symporter family protein [Bacteroidales bacterium]|nr:sodium:alanine symporter family protein [Bacteroidales bacterium]
MDFLLQQFEVYINLYNEYVGGYLILLLLVPTGMYITFRLGFLQLRGLKHALNIVRGKYSDKRHLGDITHFKALTTALSSTVGTGNIVGVALAIYWGGPGVVFWLWVTGFFGMMLKFSECTLALKFRKVNADGTVSGGPMYYIEYGLKKQLGKFAKVLASIFAVAAVLCSLGTGNIAQANGIADALITNYQIPTYVTGLFLTLLVLIIIVGGLKRIADVTEKLVPIMAIFYLLATMVVLISYASHIPAAFELIFDSAFHGTALTGGFVGSTFFMTMVMGVRRGLFSNEAGQGSAAIAHAAAKTEYPVREGFVATLEPLIDTIVICTLTALVVIVTDSWSSGIQGVGMTISAFEMGFSNFGVVGVAKHIVAFGLVMFAFSTIISWSYYGSRGVQYLMGDKYIKPYYYFYGLFVFLGSIWSIDLVWGFVDMVITFMTIPNLIALILLFPVLKKEVQNYLALKKSKNW